MFQKLELQQLQSKSLTEVIAYRADALERKAELEALKGKGGKSWTAALQDELDEIVLLVVDADELIEVKKAEAELAKAQVKVAEAKEEAKVASYQIPMHTEHMVHLKLVKGRRFDSRTGKEISEPFVQIFSHSEYVLFEKNHKALGYDIVEVLHNPYAK